MRYKIDFDKMVNQLVPHYIGGRKLILFIQALMYPLHSVNQLFVSWAKETKIEASMTSQVFKLEWFLNRRFKKYLIGDERISIKNRGNNIGVPVYYQSADINIEDNMVMYHESEGQHGKPLYYADEITDENAVSFIVFTPPIDETLITREAYLAMLSYQIDKYRLAGKTYNIIFTE